MTNAVVTEVKKYKQLIAGEWVAAEGGRTFSDMNPYSGEVFAEIPASSGADAERAIHAWWRVAQTQAAALSRRC